MRKLTFAALGFTLAASTVAFSQSREDTANDQGAAVQRSLEEKAVRVPASDLAAALKAAESGESERRTRTLPPKPDWGAVREDLDETAREDGATPDNQQTDPTIGQTTTPIRGPADRLGTPPPPPPGLRALAADRLQNVESAEVDRVLMPVLTPAHPDVRNKIKVYGLENAYTAAAAIDVNASLSISGACHRVIGGDRDIVEFRKRIAKGPPRLAGIRANYFITRNDFGVDLSFSKFNCGYVMTIECDNPADDERCSGDAYISRLADSMLLINAERAGG
ncbi:MAG: hypothetical protein DHS20C05_07730 [Hyphococcus sp.]|nr:MAG: hypothetical protein DHS20C05_07730 [Marinicaulis sp.]